MNKKTLQSYRLMLGDKYLRWYNSDTDFVPYVSNKFESLLNRWIKWLVLTDWQRVITNYVREDLGRWR